ncbi:MAG: hypothetical protein WBG90_08245 [Saonia sp.]
MKKLIFLSLYSLSLSISAQIQQINNGSFNELIFFVGISNPEYDNAEGSRYLDKEFVLAKINDIKKAQLIRFNVVENSIEVMKEGGKIMYLSQSHPYTIKLLGGSNKVYETKPYIDDNGAKNTSFFEKVHVDERYTLYRKERIKYVPKKIAKSSYDQDVPAKFVNVNDHFYMTDFKSKSSELIEIPRKKKSFLNFFKDSSNKLDKFVKKEKLKFENTDDLIKILDFYFAYK